VAVVIGGGAYAVGSDVDGGRADDLEPVRLPKMEFAAGLRGWFNPDDNQVHLGGQRFDIGNVPGLDTSASVTPHGLVYFGADQDVRLLTADGSVDQLTPALDDPDVDFYPTVKFDAKRPLAAWLTGAEDGQTLTVYRFGDDAGVVGSFPAAPCNCDDLRMAGVDQGLVFVRGGGTTMVLDPFAGADAEWSPVANAEVADVRNRVLLVEGRPPEAVMPGGPLRGNWRFASAQGPESLLTFDGAHELYWSSTLRATTPGAPALELELPPGKGTEFVNMDSDGSVLVARMLNSGETWFDCDVESEVCTEFDRSNIQSGDPGFIGNDM